MAPRPHWCRCSTTALATDCGSSSVERLHLDRWPLLGEKNKTLEIDHLDLHTSSNSGGRVLFVNARLFRFKQDAEAIKQGVEHLRR